MPKTISRSFKSSSSYPDGMTLQTDAERDHESSLNVHELQTLAPASWNHPHWTRWLGTIAWFFAYIHSQPPPNTKLHIVMIYFWWMLSIKCLRFLLGLIPTMWFRDVCWPALCRWIDLLEESLGMVKCSWNSMKFMDSCQICVYSIYDINKLNTYIYRHKSCIYIYIIWSILVLGATTSLH